jgi:hypothetical protein
MTTPSVSAHNLSTSQPPRPVLPPEDGWYSLFVQPDNSNLNEGCYFISFIVHRVPLRGIGIAVTQVFVPRDRTDV